MDWSTDCCHLFIERHILFTCPRIVRLCTHLIYLNVPLEVAATRRFRRNNQNRKRNGRPRLVWEPFLEEHTYHTYVAHRQSEQIMQSVVQNRKVHNVDASESRACEVKEKVLRRVSGPATR